MRLLGIILADASGRPVNLCGELAGREAMVPRLLEMGFRSLSIAPSLIPTTKALIRTLRLDAAGIPPLAPVRGGEGPGVKGTNGPGATMTCEHAAKVKPVPPRTPTGC